MSLSGPHGIRAPSWCSPWVNEWLRLLMWNSHTRLTGSQIRSPRSRNVQVCQAVGCMARTLASSCYRSTSIMHVWAILQPATFLDPVAWVEPDHRKANMKAQRPDLAVTESTLHQQLEIGSLRRSTEHACRHRTLGPYPSISQPCRLLVWYSFQSASNTLTSQTMVTSPPWRPCLTPPSYVGSGSGLGLR